MQPAGQFELFCPIAGVVNTSIKCSEAGFGLKGLGKVDRLLCSVVKIDKFLVVGGGGGGE